MLCGRGRRGVAEVGCRGVRLGERRPGFVAEKLGLGRPVAVTAQRSGSVLVCLGALPYAAPGRQ